MARFSRRTLLKGGAGASLAALTGCPHAPAPPVSPVSGNARVTAVSGTDLREMTREMLAAFGGIGSIVHAGETVFIKPNFCAADLVHHNTVTSGDSTKPEIVITVAEECLKAGAARVTIGDAAQVPAYRWDGIATLDGATNMAAEADRLNRQYRDRLTLACLNSESPAWDSVPTYTRLKHLKVSSIVTRSDRVISLPVLKTHRWTQVTASLKNFVGTTSVNDYGYGYPWRFRLHSAGIEQSFIDIAHAVKPDFTIIDCSVGCEGNGPHVMPGYWGTTIDMRDKIGKWVLLGGTDLVATDATAARLIGQDPERIKHLVMAYHQGLGQLHADKIAVNGDRFDNLKTEWLPAEPTDGFWDILIPGMMMLTKG